MVKSTYYFIGINGIGMSGLAEMLSIKGHDVKGSDISDTINLDHFKSLGIPVNTKQKKDNICSSDWIVVASSAIQADNEELMAAKSMGCTIIKRGKLLSDIGHSFKSRMAVVGTHGKTTTTSLAVRLFSSNQATPSYFIGGQISERSHVGLASNDQFITELDESDGSFLDMKPTSAIITNIEHDHVDFYKTKKDVYDAFLLFVTQIIDSGGQCIINLDDPLSEKIIKTQSDRQPFITYGIENQLAMVRAENIDYFWQGSRFTLVINQHPVEEVTLPLYGRHNIYNALGAIGLAISKGILLKDILNGLQSFTGVKRRLELKYKGNQIMLFDDYAHHPTEIITTLEGLYKSFPQNRIITIFQPHRYSRLTNLFDEFSVSFSRSKHVLVLDVYGAGETPDGFKTSEALVTAINQKNGNALYCPADIDGILGGILVPNDIVVLMGAGNVTQMASEVIRLIKSR